jgi:hypothetical protein
MSMASREKCIGKVRQESSSEQRPLNGVKLKTE